jgi:hypothetical protein
MMYDVRLVHLLLAALTMAAPPAAPRLTELAEVVGVR